MTGLYFVDTNVVIHAAAVKVDDPTEDERTGDMFAEGSYCSVRVENPFAAA